MALLEIHELPISATVVNENTGEFPRQYYTFNVFCPTMDCISTIIINEYVRVCDSKYLPVIILIIIYIYERVYTG